MSVGIGWVIAALIVGSIIGFIIAACCIAASDAYEERERMSKNQNKPVYRCKTNAIKECGDTCCLNCIGKHDCDYACEGNPENCGMSIQN